MKLILTALASKEILSALKDQSYFKVSEELNSFSQPIYIISYDSNEHLTQNRPIQKILPTLKALQAVFVNDFIKAIKEKNTSTLLAATMQLRAFVGYCSDLAKEIDTEKCKDQSSKLLALAKAKMINNEYSIFPDEDNKPGKKLSVDDTKWFSLQYYSLTHLKTHEYKALQEKHNDQETPLPEKAEIFGQSYELLTMFMTLDNQSFISNLPSKEEAEQAKYLYEQFCSYIPKQETLSQRLPHRAIVAAVQNLQSTTPMGQISALTDVYEVIKNNTDEENSAVRQYLLKSTSSDDLKLIDNRVNAIKQGLLPHLQNPSDKNCIRPIAEEYIHELTHTLKFFQALNEQKQEEENSNTSLPTKDESTEIQNVLKNNIESLNHLGAGLQTYHNDNQNKSPTRKKFADELLETSKKSGLTVRERVTKIEEKLNTSTEPESSSLLEKCWNVLKRIGNAAKGLWHYQNEIKRTAHFRKAADLHKSASLYELKYGSFFPAAEKLGVVKNETNSLR